MGNHCCKEKRTKKLTLLLVGLDNAGKTKAANGLIGDRVSSPVPTVGFSVLNLKYSDYTVKIFDLGGGPNIRGIWHEYFVNAHGLIFVIDSSDISRFSEVKMALEDILRSDKIAGKPILILANKQDNENAVDEIEIIEYLNLEYLVNTRKCPTLVQSCSASEHKVDTGVQKGYNWLMGYIHKHYENLNRRVETDVREQELKEKQDLLEKIQRIKTKHALEESKRNEDNIETYSDYVKKLNGEAKLPIEEPSTSLIDYEEASSTNNSSESSLSFPPVYISNTSTERPKSAVELVKRQLQMRGGSKKRTVLTRSNKTAPINLYGTRMPRSAHERRRDTLFVRRNLKSADNVLFTISGKVSDQINVFGSSGDHNTISLNNYEGKLPPLKRSEMPWVHRPSREGDGLSIVDVV